MTLRLRSIWTGLAASLALVAFAAPKARGENVVFTLDPVSFLSLDGSFNGVPFLEQGPGSRTANYTGTLTVDVDNLLAPTSIEFLSGVATASISGSWLPQAGGGPGPNMPGNPEPANYGIMLPLGAAGTAYAALRDTVLNVTGGPQAVAGGQFASTQTLTFLSGFFDSNAGLLAPPNRDDVTNDTRTNMSPNMSSYSVVGNTATLTIVYADLVPDDITTALTGRLLATATVPEPSCGWLLGLAGIGLIRRRRGR